MVVSETTITSRGVATTFLDFLFLNRAGTHMCESGLLHQTGHLPVQFNGPHVQNAGLNRDICTSGE